MLVCVVYVSDGENDALFVVQFLYFLEAVFKTFPFPMDPALMSKGRVL